ncbi:hypothetical protein HP456_11195 [Bacillus haikouensis]|jgi:hypothetical protein|uniref:hypothetical protein n=1 Tax=Bacillus haikouensis TaxID=1510468 RepID=UPI00155833F1|nr:hypothetical protein [Bacillus haikouensis]NQD66482.1 hypothetical protein [Bacillus haikouensis]
MENLFRNLFYETKDTMKYLKRLEGKTGKVKNFNDIEYLKKIIKDNHTKSEISYFIEDLETTNSILKNLSNQIISWIITTIGFMITLTIAVFVLFGNIGIKLVDLNKDTIGLIEAFDFIDLVFVLISTSFLSICLLIFLYSYFLGIKRNKYLRILKSIQFEEVNKAVKSIYRKVR